MLDKIITQAHKKLLSGSKTISVAESCSGGLLCSLLTELPGSSKYFLLGIVTYSNSSKEKFINIPKKTIAKYGVVSDKVAILMAENIRRKTNSDFGLSLTGIAGPTGATLSKPVGTVFICLAYKKKTVCRRFAFRGKRQAIRKKSAYAALRLLCAHL